MPTQVNSTIDYQRKYQCERCASGFASVFAAPSLQDSGGPGKSMGIVNPRRLVCLRRSYSNSRGFWVYHFGVYVRIPVE